jgi:hypothetical protein
MVISAQGWYGLIGAEGILNPMSLTNNTAPITVTGTYLKPTYSDFINPDYTFQGDLFPAQITVNGQPYIVTNTAVILNYQNGSTVAVTSTQIYGVPTQSGYLPITVSGILAWSTPGCVTPLTSSTQLNGQQLAIGLIVAVAIILVLAYLINHSRKKQVRKPRKRRK